jgi:hypothetical protein
MAEPLTAPLSADEQRERRQAVRDVMLTTPFIGGLGIVFERYQPDLPNFESPFGCRSAKTSPTTAPTFMAG